MKIDSLKIATTLFFLLTARVASGQTADGCPLIQVTSSLAGESANPRLSSDGGRITFASTSNLTGGNPDGSYEVMLYERSSGVITQLSNSSTISTIPSISADGNKVAFFSYANLTGQN